jgi:hypothetical protein
VITDFFENRAAARGRDQASGKTLNTRRELGGGAVIGGIAPKAATPISVIGTTKGASDVDSFHHPEIEISSPSTVKRWAKPSEAHSM